MKTNDLVRDERTIIDPASLRHGRGARRLRAGLVAGVGLALAAVLGGCSSGALSSGSLAIPSVDASAAASMGSELALGVLDQVDAAITANESSGGLSAENATTLKDLTASIRTSLQSGNLSEAKTAFAQLAAKVDEFASGLTGDAGTKLNDAISSLKTAVGS